MCSIVNTSLIWDTGDLCSCGPVPSDYTQIDSSACNQPCAGNNTELCGQNGIIQEYELVACVTMTPASNTLSSDTAAGGTLLQGSRTLPVTNALTM